MNTPQRKEAYLLILSCESAEQRQQILNLLLTELPELAGNLAVVDLKVKGPTKPLLVGCMSKEDADRAVKLIKEQFPQGRFEWVHPTSGHQENNGALKKRRQQTESDWTWVIDILMSILFFAVMIALILSRTE